MGVFFQQINFSHIFLSCYYFSCCHVSHLILNSLNATHKIGDWFSNEVVPLETFAGSRSMTRSNSSRHPYRLQQWQSSLKTCLFWGKSWISGTAGTLFFYYYSACSTGCFLSRLLTRHLNGIWQKTEEISSRTIQKMVVEYFLEQLESMVTGENVENWFFFFVSEV